MAFDHDHTPFAIDGACISDVALAVDATLIHESTAAAAYLRQQILDLAMAGSNLSVAVRWSGNDRSSADTFRFLCDRLGAALDDAGARSCKIGLLVDAISLAPLTAWNIRNAHLGTGPLYVSTSQQLMQECHWEQLWQQRSNAMIRPVYVSFVSSQCRLLPVEAANGVIPCTDIQAPTGSAWVNVPVDISSYADIDGDLDEEALELTIRAGVEAGDETHSLARWPTAQMRHDGWLNRRLAINLTGIGTLVQRRDADPTRFHTLDEMCRLISRIRDVALTQSQRLASSKGNVPALEQGDPTRLMPGGQSRDGWSRRWQQEVTATAVRHRNLLVISPWSIFPPDDADLRFANLLPLLRYADTCSFGPPPELTAWNLKDFKNFHQQAAAVLHQRGRMQQIAVHA
jgi:hypothetical protein